MNMEYLIIIIIIIIIKNVVIRVKQRYSICTRMSLSLKRKQLVRVQS